MRAAVGGKPGRFRQGHIALLAAVVTALLPLHAQSQSGVSNAEARAHDIGIIIDNRPPPEDGAARADIDALIGMLDRQMLIEHVILLERPSFPVICGVFGCPSVRKSADAHPSLIRQITHQDAARLIVYYIGEGRIEGVERQLLFSRRDGAAAGDVVGFAVGWLQEKLEEAAPKSAMLILDSGFSPRPLPCAGAAPAVIDDALGDVRRIYRRLARTYWRPSDVIEIAATTPVLAPPCDRSDETGTPLFTETFLAAVVQGEADRDPFGDEDHLIDLDELLQYLDDRLQHASRIPWEDPQHARVTGPGSQVVASVDRRPLQPDNATLLARRYRTAEETASPADAAREPKAEAQTTADGPETASHCTDDPDAEDCHPCRVDPLGQTCADRCEQDIGSGSCMSIVVPGASRIAAEMAPASTETDVLAAADQGDWPAKERSGACRLTAEHVAPYAAVPVAWVQGETRSACGWALDNAEPELGPLAQIFTPVAWRLGRSSVQDAFVCLLDCDRAEATAATSIAGGPWPGPSIAQTDQAYVDPRRLGAFNRQICDRLHAQLPPYIGLPRWMPGTLMISEALRASYGCPPEPAEPALPAPVAVAIDVPPMPAMPSSDSDRSAALSAADDRLARWPPYAISIDPGEPQATRAPSGVGGDRASDGPRRAGDVTGGAPLAPGRAFMPTAAEIRRLQSALTVDNRNPGPIDGVMGRQTMEAVQSWRRDRGRDDERGPLTAPEYDAILEAFEQRFSQVQESAQPF